MPGLSLAGDYTRQRCVATMEGAVVSGKRAAEAVMTGSHSDEEYRASMLQRGDKAPDFSLLDQRGQLFTLSTSLEQLGVRHFLYFYPRADTPGCTAQSCALRDVAGDVGDTAIVGISPDPPPAQARFDQKYGLGFTLLSDEDHAVAEAYGAWGEKTMYGRKFMGIVRSALLIDRHCRVVEAWPKISPKDTPKKLLAALAG